MCLPLVVFAFLFTDDKTVCDLKQFLLEKGEVPSVNTLFQKFDDEDMVTCQGVKIPQRWMEFPTIKALC